MCGAAPDMADLAGGGWFLFVLMLVYLGIAVRSVPAERVSEPRCRGIRSMTRVAFGGIAIAIGTLVFAGPAVTSTTTRSTRVPGDRLRPPM